MNSIYVKKQRLDPLDLTAYDVNQHCGFLPPHPPSQVPLPAVFQPIQDMAAQLPKWMTTGTVGQQLAALPEINVQPENLDDGQLRRAMLIYAYLTHTYVWRQATPPQILPRNLAVPFYQIAQQLGRPPVLSYASYALDNWIRLDATQPIELGNIWIAQNFLGGLDEDWFILIHIDIEAKAAPALATIPDLLLGIVHENIPMVLHSLDIIRDTWVRINATMNRMPEACDPYIYYNRVRPYIHAWKNNPALPDGLIYEGVEAYSGQPQQFRGETGAQSAIVPTMDALFNIQHAPGLLRDYLMEMRDYMPPKHRALIAAVEERSTLRQFVKTHLRQTPRLGELYNECVSLMEQFRTQHLEFAARYINSQAAKANNDPNVGTGGTPFMQYLKKHRDESTQHLLNLSDENQNPS